MDPKLKAAIEDAENALLDRYGPSDGWPGVEAELTDDPKDVRYASGSGPRPIERPRLPVAAFGFSEARGLYARDPRQGDSLRIADCNEATAQSLAPFMGELVAALDAAADREREKQRARVAEIDVAVAAFADVRRSLAARDDRPAPPDEVEPAAGGVKHRDVPGWRGPQSAGRNSC